MRGSAFAVHGDLKATAWTALGVQHGTVATVDTVAQTSQPQPSLSGGRVQRSPDRRRGCRLARVVGQGGKVLEGHVGTDECG